MLSENLFLLIDTSSDMIDLKYICHYLFYSLCVLNAPFFLFLQWLVRIEKRYLINFCLVEMLFYFFFFLICMMCELMQMSMQPCKWSPHSFGSCSLLSFLISDIKRQRENVKGFPTSLVRSPKVIIALVIYIEKHSLSCLQSAWWWCWRDNIQFVSLGTTFYLF